MWISSVNCNEEPDIRSINLRVYPLRIDRSGISTNGLRTCTSYYVVLHNMDIAHRSLLEFVIDTYKRWTIIKAELNLRNWGIIKQFVFERGGTYLHTSSYWNYTAYSYITSRYPSAFILLLILIAQHYYECSNHINPVACHHPELRRTEFGF